MNMSIAINVFIKTVVREGRIPFEISAYDPFYSETNMKRLMKSIQSISSGQGKGHELIEEDR